LTLNPNSYITILLIIVLWALEFKLSQSYCGSWTD